MRIDIITVLPEMIEGFFNCSIMKRAQNKGLAEIHIHNLRDYTEDKYRRVDDYPFGGFAGMVMKIEPIERCINALKAERDYDEVIFTTPDGEQFNQPMANTLSLAQNLIILCGHFKGIDYRIREHLITKEISIGDYVLTGGELAAAERSADVAGLSDGAGVDLPRDGAFAGTGSPGRGRIPQPRAHAAKRGRRARAPRRDHGCENGNRSDDGGGFSQIVNPKRLC